MKATRITSDAGTTLGEPSFFGPEGEKLYGCLHRPAGDARFGVVICPSIHAELLSNYRAEVLVARSLAARGIAVQRFHYRGQGHSDGNTEDNTFELFRDDALAATDELVRRTAVEKVGLLGTRLGALVAGSVMQERHVSALALWEPVTDGRRYFREVVRLQSVHALKESAGPVQGPVGIKAIEELGAAPVLGYEITRPLFATASRNLVEDLVRVPPDVLIVQMSKKAEVRPAFATLRDHLEAKGAAVEVHLVDDEPVWWLMRMPMEGLDQLVEKTTDWFASVFTERGAR